MLFNSLVFAVFFLAVLALHWSLPWRARNLFLLASSYVFYASWNWKFLGLILLSTAVDYVAGRVIGASPSRRTRRVALLASLVTNLSILAFFKYFNFFVESLDELLAPFGLGAAALRLDLVLPIGISFYTLQTMSYTIDVWRGRMQPVRNVVDFALFVSFFPQLVAGPIERAPRLVPQLQSQRRLEARDLHEGFVLVLWGLFKKVVVADNLARIVDPVFAAGADPGGLAVVLAMYAFTFQLYADFSSYSDIARGTARMLGIRLMLNFQMPYFARDMGEFWRRWHISLSTWLRDYLYIPLGGNRGSEARVAFNLWLTLFLAGIWHGSNGTFLLWGAFHGVLVVAARRYRAWRPVHEEARRWPGALLSFHLYLLSLLAFRADTVAQTFDLLGRALSDLAWQPAAGLALAKVVLYALPVLVFDALHWRSGDELFVLRWRFASRVLVYFLVIQAILLLGRSDGLEFIYFQF